MFGIGFPELVLILLVALIIFGPSKLPDLAKTLGKAVREFRKATEDFQASLLDENPEEPKKTAKNERSTQESKDE